MKKNFVYLSVLFGGLLGSALPTFAESIELRVPFEFEAGGKALPAGLYTVETSANILTMSGAMPGAMVTMLAEIVNPGLGEASPKASFTQGSGMKMLASVTLGSGVTYIPLPAKHAGVAAVRPPSADVALSRR